jgi:hypothetical protein
MLRILHQWPTIMLPIDRLLEFVPLLAVFWPVLGAIKLAERLFCR